MSALRSLTTSLLAGALFTLSSVSFVQAEDDEFPRDALRGIEAMKRLPAEGFQIVESKGRLLLVSLNGHYVVTGGRILDLWNRMEIKSVADVDATTRIPLTHLGLKTQNLGGFSTGDGKSKAVTVFLDPASPQSLKILPTLRAVAKGKQVDLVFIPAQAARAGVSRALICDPTAAKVFFEHGRVPEPVPGSKRCGIDELQKARITAELLGIRSLPFSVAPNGATASGVPQNYDAFVSANWE